MTEMVANEKKYRYSYKNRRGKSERFILGAGGTCTKVGSHQVEYQLAACQL